MARRLWFRVRLSWVTTLPTPALKRTSARKTTISWLGVFQLSEGFLVSVGDVGNSLHAQVNIVDGFAQAHPEMH